MIYDEIVIGAGIAGLYWIYKTKPLNYLVLEKSNRIGGRIYNINWNGSQISLGGGIIKSSNDYIINLANEFGLNFADGISKYEMIDWVEVNEKKSNNNESNNNESNNNESNNNKPNESNFYTLNTNIIKYLKKIYQSNKNEIDNNKINFEEFIDLYVELKISQLIKLNFLYKTYFNADVCSVLYDEIDELLRTQDFHYKYITN
jgi:monoamine oxidase